MKYIPFALKLEKRLDGLHAL